MRIKFRDAPRRRTCDDDNPKPIAEYSSEQYLVLPSADGIWRVFRKDGPVDAGAAVGTADALRHLDAERAHNIRTTREINRKNREFWSRP